MPVAEALFDPLLEFYRALPVDAQDQRAHLVEHRADIKLLVDSVWEQAIANILHAKPRNHLEARRCINHANLDALSTPDAGILRSLLAVLDDYDLLAGGDPYIDRGEPLTSLVRAPLAQLCLNLAAHPAHHHSELARTLRNLLSGMAP